GSRKAIAAQVELGESGDVVPGLRPTGILWCAVGLSVRAPRREGRLLDEAVEDGDIDHSAAKRRQTVPAWVGRRASSQDLGPIVLSRAIELQVGGTIAAVVQPSEPPVRVFTL